MKRINLAAKKFGRLTVLGYVGPHKHGGSIWRCKCECGKVVDVKGYYLTTGHTSSCGCLCYEKLRASNITHGKSGTREHLLWKAIRQRCFNPKYREYYLYGGRGIKMCKEWANDFQKFLDFVGERPSPTHSIDRWPDNNGDYEPGNVRWATRIEQQNNKRNNRFFEYAGKRTTLANWARLLKIKYAILHRRLRRGWSFKEAVEMTIRKSPVKPL